MPTPTDLRWCRSSTELHSGHRLWAQTLSPLHSQSRSSHLGSTVPCTCHVKRSFEGHHERTDDEHSELCSDYISIVPTTLPTNRSRIILRFHAATAQNKTAVICFRSHFPKNFPYYDYIIQTPFLLRRSSADAEGLPRNVGTTIILGFLPRQAQLGL